MVAPLCQQAMDLNFDGLIVESHCNPDCAWSDASQQVTPDVLDYILNLLVILSLIHIFKLELVDNKSNNVMNGIAFGQSSHVRYIKTKRSFDICYTIEENTHKRGEVQLQIEDIKPIE